MSLWKHTAEARLAAYVNSEIESPAMSSPYQSDPTYFDELNKSSIDYYDSMDGDDCAELNYATSEGAKVFLTVSFILTTVVLRIRQHPPVLPHRKAQTASKRHQPPDRQPGGIRRAGRALLRARCRSATT